MRHRNRRTRLSVKMSHRKAMMRNMVRSLFQYQKIETTLRKAKEARRLAEHLITTAKTDSVAARRRAFSVLGDRDSVMNLFKEVIPLFKNRNSGYTRIIHLGFRRGDGADLAILELTEKKIIEKQPKKKEKAKAEESKVKEPAEAKVKHAEEKKEAKKEEPKAKTLPKSKPTLDEEKKHEKAKVEDKKMADQKKFMKNLRGFFRRKSDM